MNVIRRPPEREEGEPAAGAVNVDTDESDEPPGDHVKGSTPGNGVHPHAPPPPPAERER